MEPIEVDGTGNGVCPHVGEHNPVPISQERERVLSDNSIQTIAGGTKQCGPA